MKIQEVIDIAKYSELQSVAVKDDINGIVAFLNMGMHELYTRFPLKTKEFVVELVTGEFLYDLPDDCMYVLSAFKEPDANTGSDELEEVCLNDSTAKYSVFFPDWKTVQVPEEITSSFVTLIYVAKPATITADNLDIELELPEPLIDALMSYLGYRAHLGIRSDGQSENNANWQRFERNCNIARDRGVAFPVDALDTRDRLFNRGFV